MKKRVVITGMDICSSIGSGLNKFWEAAKKGSCGIRRVQAYDPSPYPTQIAGEITDLSLAHLPDFDNPNVSLKLPNMHFFVRIMPFNKQV